MVATRSLTVFQQRMGWMDELYLKHDNILILGLLGHVKIKIRKENYYILMTVPSTPSTLSPARPKSPNLSSGIIQYTLD